MCVCVPEDYVPVYSSVCFTVKFLCCKLCVCRPCSEEDDVPVYSHPTALQWRPTAISSLSVQGEEDYVPRRGLCVRMPEDYVPVYSPVCFAVKFLRCKLCVCRPCSEEDDVPVYSPVCFTVKPPACNRNE